jgi:PAS domain S-box-containing protein
MRDEKQNLIAQYAVTRALAESASLDEATPKILQAVCESLGWQFGALWVVDRDADVLRSVESWRNSSVELAEFEKLSQQPAFKRGEGLPGIVWASGEAEWVKDITVNKDYPRRSIAAEAGLHAALCFPIKFGGQTIGAMEFFSREVRPPDETLLHMMENLGSQLGQFIERKRAEAEREQSEERYRSLAEAMPQLVWATDENGSHFYYNRRWYEYTGLTEEESMGFGFANALHPEDKERTLARWQRAWRDGESYEIEYRFYSRPRGEYRWFLGRAVPVRDAAGKIRQWVGTCTDIEEQKQIEEQLAELNREREEMLEEVSTPLVPVWRGVLALPLIGSLDTERMQKATDAALSEVTRTGARACIIDITGARIIDSHAVANLSYLVSSLKLIGAEAIVTGVTAHAAQTLVGLGVDLADMHTHRTLAEALAGIIKGNGKRRE